MRAHRKRFTVSSVRLPLARALKVKDGVAKFRQNPQGMGMRRELIGECWLAQGKKCAVCGQDLDLGQAAMLDKEFTRDRLPLVVHKKCRRGRGQGEDGHVQVGVPPAAGGLTY